MTNPERAVAQALRAQAGQASHPNQGSGPRPMPHPTSAPTSPTTPSGQRMAPPRKPFPTGWVLLIALLLGAVVGVGLALLSIFQPGMLPSWQLPS
ncbi:MAG TPA: hypothetical protein VFE65_20230 [Pseudonocardia sp.]|jgi:hypothetical protein|nr:hypothetical protein [Pseudonocardia sp.]